jgi:flagellar basal body-associated protein FliL
MRMFIMLAVAVAVVVAVFGVKTLFNARSADHALSITKAMATSNTLSPHEMHLNYKAMKELPVNEVKEPF